MRHTQLLSILCLLYRSFDRPTDPFPLHRNSKKSPSLHTVELGSVPHFVWKRKIVSSVTSTVLCAHRVCWSILCVTYSVQWAESLLSIKQPSYRSAHKIPHHECIEWDFFWCGRGQLLFFNDMMMKAFLRTKLNWVGSKPTGMYDVREWVMNVPLLCGCSNSASPSWIWWNPRWWTRIFSTNNS